MPTAARRKANQALKDSPMLPATRRSNIGRPSLYKPEYCGLIEQWGKEGKSQAQMCSLINIGRATFFEWIGLHPEFAASALRAKEHAQSWWEAKAQGSLGKKQFQAQLWRYSMMGRFKDDYGDNGSSRVDITLDLGGAIAEIEARRRPSDAKPIEVASSFAPLADPKKPKE